MKYETFEQLYVQFTDSLAEVRSAGLGPVKILSEVLAVCGSVLKELRSMVLEDSFADEAAEIHFFKHVKPKFFALKIFHFELYGLLMGVPVGTKEAVLAFYSTELAFIARFFSLHAAAYDYYRNDRSELDHLYFVRSAEVLLPPIPEMPVDPEYATAMDYLFAKFMAFESLQGEILKRIAVLDASLVAPDVAPVERGIKWTGKTVNLCELIYGLYYTGQLNHGNTQLSEIVSVFERMFLVKIRDVHHTFGEIRERKVSSPSKFIDSMAAAIRDRVDEDLSYKPH